MQYPRRLCRRGNPVPLLYSSSPIYDKMTDMAKFPSIKNKKKIIGFTCGAFDITHAGHYLMFKEIKKKCDYLVVGLQTDPSIDREYKNKPVQSVKERLIQLESCKYIDKVLTYTTEDDLIKLLKKLKPDVRFLGSDWKGKDFTGKDLPIKVVFNKRDHNFSSSSLRAKIVNNGHVKRIEKKVFVSGCYDILHGGHIEFFNQAKALGDYLIVSFASEKTLEKYKNKKSSIPEEHKRKILESLRMVDEVVMGDNLDEVGLDFKNHFLKIKPDILAVTEDDHFSEQKIDLCEQIGAKYVVLPKNLDFKKTSTSEIIHKIKHGKNS